MGAYREAGVDLRAAARAVGLIRDLGREASRPEVVAGIGGFAGLFRLPGGGLLAAAADGVGTKAEVARLAGRLDTIGIDLVAMCVNDVACTGAEPLFFLDYIAVGRLVPDEIAALIAGMAEGCRRAGCALLGGETAEHPGVMDPDRFDLAGFCVGLVDEGSVLGPGRVREGDVLVGLASSGLHANGFSLVRRVLLESGRYRLDETPEGLARPLADELLEPTSIYVDLVLHLTRAGVVSAAAHVTGGGIIENLLRALPPRLGAQVDPGGWVVPPIFDLVRRAAGLPEDEMLRTFNVGVGMVLVVPAGGEDEVLSAARDRGTRAAVIGRVVRTPGVHVLSPVGRGS